MTNRVPVEERLCTVCGVIEDEYHCLIECIRFDECRRGCLPKNLVNKPSTFEFVVCFRSGDEREMKMLSVLCTRVLREYRKYV